MQRVLFLSNGHGEDICNSQILKSFTELQPEAKVAAMPIVGDGDAYRRLGVPIIGPTSRMPSGGVFYMNPLFFLKDIKEGLVSLTCQQLKAMRAYCPKCDLIVATGDIVVAAIACLMQRPFVVFLSAYSSYYEGKLRLGFLNWQLLNSPRCLRVFTRDAFTAWDLNQQGLTKAEFVGTPVMDTLSPTGIDLQLTPGVPAIALLPGSRLPEASHNLRLQLQLAQKIAQVMDPLPVQFRAALIPSLMSELDAIASALNWQHQAGKLFKKYTTDSQPKTVEVHCYSEAFADILQQSNLVIGQTGTAVEQAVGLGKPVITIPGAGPAFTYRFAEAQQRLLGSSVQVIGTQPATPKILQEAAARVKLSLLDSNYLETCLQNGFERMGPSGGSIKIAQYLENYLQSC